MRKKILFLSCVLLAFVLLSTLVDCQTKAVSWSTFNMGYEISTSPLHAVKSAMGQVFVTQAQTSGKGLQSGFLADTLLRKVIFSSSFTVSKSWNMVSLPLVVSDNHKAVLFPTAVSNAFAYQGGKYVSKDTLSFGTGYWLKFNSEQSVSVTGIPILTDTLYVNQGWNMIGSISIPILTSSVSSIPPHLGTSDFFSYRGSYFTTTIIQPGGAYWVKVDTAGKLILSTTSSSSIARIKITPCSELPPPPPKDNVVGPLPKEFALQQNYPNPFNPTTQIRYSLPQASHVKLSVFNMLGQEVTIIFNGMQDAGEKTMQFNASNFSSGVYYYKLQTERFTDIKKMVVVK